MSEVPLYPDDSEAPVELYHTIQGLHVSAVEREQRRETTTNEVMHRPTGTPLTQTHREWDGVVDWLHCCITPFEVKEGMMKGNNENSSNAPATKKIVHCNWSQHHCRLMGGYFQTPSTSSASFLSRLELNDEKNLSLEYEQYVQP
jgi:hypothetical protein